MRTAFLTLALSLVTLPAIANPETYLWISRNTASDLGNRNVLNMSDQDLLEMGVLQCSMMSSFVSLDAYLPWMEADAVEAGLSDTAIEALQITAIAADRQLCDDPRIQELMQQ